MQFKYTCSLLITIMYSLNIFAGESDLYDFLWLDPDKSVYVLQNKVHKKNKRFTLDLGYVSGTASPFQDTTGGQIKFGYYFTENWAVEANFMQYSNADNTSRDNIISVSGDVPFERKPLSSQLIFAIWSPFYGKINTFNNIYYLDWSFGVGTGKYTTESNIKTVTDPTKADRFTQEEYTPIALKTNVKFHINQTLNLGVEFMSTNFQAETNPNNTSQKKWKRNNDIIFSIGVSF